MKLKKYDASINSGRTSHPTISFSDIGVIRISKGAAEEIGLKSGVRLSLCQDEENPTDWYLTKDKDGFETRPGTSKDNGSIMFNSTKTRNDFYTALFESDEDREWPKRFRLATEPTVLDKKPYYAILIPNE